MAGVLLRCNLVQVLANSWIVKGAPLITGSRKAGGIYEACPESKDTKVLNMYNIFNLQKRHCE